MSIQTNVPNSLNRPQDFHTFTFQRAGGALTNVPLRIALIGAKLTTGATSTANTVYDLGSLVNADTDTLFGASSELALMCRQAAACAALFGRGPRVFAVPIGESAGVANVQTITCVGTATSTGNQTVRVAGRTFIVGVTLGDSQNTNAAAIASALKARAVELPVIVTVATNVVTLTHATKGVNGADIKVTVDQQIAGIVATVATTVAGTSVTDHQPAFDALAPLRYDGIACANHASADITEILADIAARWAASSKTWAFYTMGEMGTISTATALAAAANDKALSICSMEGCLNTAGEMATTLAMLIWSRERPNASYDGAKVPLYPPAAATIYTNTEVETAISAGLTAFTAVLDSSGSITQNLAKCERLITTHTTLSGQPDILLRDIGIPRTAVALASQINVASAQRFGADSNPDGVTQDAGTDSLIKDMVASILRAEARVTPPVVDPAFVEADIAATIIEHDQVTLGRTNVGFFYHPVGSQHQIAWQHNLIVGS